LDLFRFWVLFFMIQGHLFRSYLLPEIRHAHWYFIHEVFHGMVAPGFLFASGFAAFLSFHNKREQYLKLDKTFFTRLRRILFVIWIGYWIHLPFLSLRQTIQAIAAGKANDFLRVDILQCIGTGLLLFTVIAVLAKNEKLVVALAAIFGLLFFLLPGVLRGIHLPAAIQPYFYYDYDYRVSLFPLFPWAGFLFLGACVAYFYTRVSREWFFRTMLILGVFFFPWFFFQKNVLKAELTLTGNLNKIAGVFILFWLSELMIRKCPVRLTGILRRAGKESLFVYALHLFIIFNSFFRAGLKVRFENSLNVIEAIALFLLLQFVVFALSLFYNYLKEKQYFLWRVGFYIFWGAFLVVFLVKPH